MARGYQNPHFKAFYQMIITLLRKKSKKEHIQRIKSKEFRRKKNEESKKRK